VKGKPDFSTLFSVWEKRIVCGVFKGEFTRPFSESELASGCEEIQRFLAGHCPKKSRFLAFDCDFELKNLTCKQTLKNRRLKY